MTRRTRGREIALQVLYQLEQNPGQGPDRVSQFIRRRLREDKLCEFASDLVAGVQDHQPRIDTLISEVAENWRLDRMAAIDRNILRLGAFELLYCGRDVPAKVAINEALELAKRYSTAQSSRFVNGILDRLIAAGAEQDVKKMTDAAGANEPESKPFDVRGSEPNPESTSATPAEIAEAVTELETEGVGGLAVEPDSSHEPLPTPEDPSQPPVADQS